jgi:DNA invertase Pin-like site-specific DNA recombinase
MMARRKTKSSPTPTAGWAIYLRTSSDENQKPELSQTRQRYAIEKNVIERSDMPVFDEYIDVLTGTTPQREAYQRLLEDARAGRFSHVIVERADRFGRNDTEALRAIDELHEFGVAVRFANQPDLNPMDPDDRVIVALSFTLARRESALLGLRVRGGVKAKRDTGGHHGKAPDGYRNVSSQVVGEAKKVTGRYDHWLELDPERVPIIRLAWDLLLEERYTLKEICEELHRRGHHYKSGRPFIEVEENGRRKANYNTLAAMFHNWTYAGWVTSKVNNVPPKTIRGNWEAIVTTEEFEQGLAILDKRNQKRVPNRKHDYLLRGLVCYRDQEQGQDIRLTCSTTNSSRSNGGTAYYRIAGRNIRFLCHQIDEQISVALRHIQVDPEYIPAIQAVYTSDIARKMGHLRPDERKALETALRAVDEEEARAVRLFATGKITETVWDGLWREWQDRRNQLRCTLDSLQERQQTHIENLDAALQVISYVGIVYNELSRDDKRELLRQMVERVVVDSAGNAKLELRTPFAYLHDISDQIRSSSEETEATLENKETADNSDLGKPGCSTQVLLCGECRNLTEPLPSPNTRFLQLIDYPHRAEAARFSNLA